MQKSYVVIYCRLDFGIAGLHNVGTARKITVVQKKEEMRKDK